jgi:hypothetical protein
MLKNESARNATKPVPLRPSRLPDSGGIFTYVKRSPYGEDIAFCPKSQTGKILMLTGQSVQSRTDTWQSVQC